MSIQKKSALSERSAKIARLGLEDSPWFLDVMVLSYRSCEKSIALQPFSLEQIVISAVAITLSNPRFWSMKIKIAILAAATYAAMC